MHKFRDAFLSIELSSSGKLRFFLHRGQLDKEHIYSTKADGKEQSAFVLLRQAVGGRTPQGHTSFPFFSDPIEKAPQYDIIK